MSHSYLHVCICMMDSGGRTIAGNRFMRRGILSIAISSPSERAPGWCVLRHGNLPLLQNTTSNRNIPIAVPLLLPYLSQDVVLSFFHI